MKNAKPQKPYWKMSAEELAEATKEFDRPIPASKMRPLTKEERRRWERAKRQPSRSIFILEPARGKPEPVLIELDAELLRRLDDYAQSRKMTRAQAIERGIQSALLFVQDSPSAQRSRKSA